MSAPSSAPSSDSKGQAASLKRQDATFGLSHEKPSVFYFMQKSETEYDKKDEDPECTCGKNYVMTISDCSCTDDMKKRWKCCFECHVKQERSHHRSCGANNHFSGK